MGCSASVVLLLRSVGGADCGHMCSRQDQMSLDAATPTLEGYTTTTSPLTIIVMVTSTTALPATFSSACVGRWRGLQHVGAE
ncbi:dedicator of cytokinesis protein 10 isoform X1 [Lates japonicus]|uniref:Dedicator of cytokinesis protein 10 isoform X1 n=1 Tax=Lates japonicus TaxID=270547 RepID=A0AAD3NFV3_LATJO|nr:dedicator of cytokinesis protein 10 isoform X1 [Lates japonicus]